MNGDHLQIRKWRREQQLRKTLKNRPDLLEGAALSEEDRRLLDAIRANQSMSEIVKPCADGRLGRTWRLLDRVVARLCEAAETSSGCEEEQSARLCRVGESCW